MGYTTQLFIALVYKTGTKSMLRQSSSTLVKYVNYLIVISININENCRREQICQKEKQGEKRCRKFISQNSFTHLFNIQMTKFIYYPTVYIRSNCLFLLCHGSLNYCPVNTFTIDWHYTMAWLPASLLKPHRRLSTCATTMRVYGSFITGDVVQQR